MGATVAPYLQSGFPWHTPDVTHPHLTTADAWWDGLFPVLESACLAVGASHDVAAQASRAVRELYLTPETWAVFDDVEPALRSLTEMGWHHIVLSNHVPELPELVVRLGLNQHFDQVLSSGTLGYEKPHPSAFSAALSAAGHPERAYMIGDDVVADVLGAEKAGLEAILVRGSDDRATRCCERLLDVADLLLTS